MIKGEKNKRLLVLLFASMLFAAGCSSSNSASRLEEPYVKQDLSGVWVGYFGDNFAIGIISTEDQEHYSAWFIGSNIQYVSPAGSFLAQVAPSSIFQGYLNDFEWDTAGLDYQSGSRSLFISGPVQTKSLFGGGLFPGGYYQYVDNPLDTNAMIFYYNTTYSVVSPNVNNMSGNWEMKDEFKTGNTLVLTIALSSNTTGTTISGKDDLGNTFDGTITIHYNPTPHNVYDVKLTLNNTIDLTGLATYVSGVSTEGIKVPKSLAIGATGTNNGITYSLTGLGDVKQ
jgi:hypothetical protein